MKKLPYGFLHESSIGKHQESLTLKLGNFLFFYLSREWKVFDKICANKNVGDVVVCNCCRRVQQWDEKYEKQMALKYIKSSFTHFYILLLRTELFVSKNLQKTLKRFFRAVNRSQVTTWEIFLFYFKIEQSLSTI